MSDPQGKQQTLKQPPSLFPERHEPCVVEVQETREGRYTQRVHVGPHRFDADEPEAVGGDDAGPSPYDLLLAALGACTAMTLRMFAEREGWPLVRVTVGLCHAKEHADDCEHCEEDGGRKLDHIERAIRIEGPLDDTQRERLMEIARRCPVHRTLEAGSVHVVDVSAS